MTRIPAHPTPDQVLADALVRTDRYFIYEEWGVRFTSPYSSHVTECKDEADARRIAAGPTQRGCTNAVVARRIIAEKWMDRP